jgi:hypothetical protein
MSSHSCVLVVAEPQLRDALALAVRTNGYGVFECQTPLDAIQVLERHSSDIGYAVLSSATPRAFELRELLAEEYPAIQPLLLSA